MTTYIHTCLHANTFSTNNTYKYVKKNSAHIHTCTVTDMYTDISAGFI